MMLEEVVIDVRRSAANKFTRLVGEATSGSTKSNLRADLGERVDVVDLSRLRLRRERQSSFVRELGHFLQQGGRSRRARRACLCTAKGLAQLRHDVYENAGGEFAGDTSSSVNITLVELCVRRSPKYRRSRAATERASRPDGIDSRVFSSAAVNAGTSELRMHCTAYHVDGNTRQGRTATGCAEFREGLRMKGPSERSAHRPDTCRLERFQFVDIVTDIRGLMFVHGLMLASE